MSEFNTVFYPKLTLLPYHRAAGRAREARAGLLCFYAGVAGPNRESNPCCVDQDFGSSASGVAKSDF